jgi:predicted DNA-binding protein (UPF0278 family)
MDGIFTWLRNIFRAMLNSTIYRYQMRMQGEIRKRTVGKVQERLNKGMSNLDRSVNRAQDKALKRDGGQPRKGPPPPSEKG